MNKLLTTILLCFSVAANAEVWFCEPDFKIFQIGDYIDLSSNFEVTTINQGLECGSILRMVGAEGRT